MEAVRLILLMAPRDHELRGTKNSHALSRTKDSMLNKNLTDIGTRNSFPSSEVGGDCVHKRLPSKHILIHEQSNFSLCAVLCYLFTSPILGPHSAIFSLDFSRFCSAFSFGYLPGV